MITYNRTAESLAFEVDQSQTIAIKKINDRAGIERMRIDEAIPGQEKYDRERYDEAVHFVAQPSPPTDLTDYPFIAAEVGVTAPTAPEVAQVILNLQDLWRAVAAPLEGLRLTAVNSVETATTTTEIDTAVTDYETQLDVLG